MTERAIISPPSRRLARKVGGAAQPLITEAVIEAAAQCVSARSEEARSDIEARLDQLRAAHAEGAPDSARRIHQHAHDIRGVAGTFGQDELGAIADSLCAYVDGLALSQAYDGALVESLIQALRGVSATGASPLSRTVAESAKIAVDKALRLEGRANGG